MNKVKIAQELIKLAKELVGNSSRTKKAYGKKPKSWRGVQGELSFEVGDMEHHRDSGVRSAYKEIVKLLPEGSEPGDWDIFIEFESSGSYCPGRLSGPPEDCYPEESEDAREATSMELRWAGDGEKIKNIEIRHGASFEKIEEGLSVLIEGVELNHEQGYDGPEPDDWD
jgi:hypothetical protein